MDIATMKKSLKDSIFDVFENMFFLPVQPYSHETTLNEWMKGQGRVVGSRLNFRTSSDGLFYLFIPEDDALDASSSFLAVNRDQVTAEQMKDIVKEILNMIGGRALSMEDPSGNFSLGIPEFISETEVQQIIKASDLNIIPIETDRGHLAIGFNI